MMTKSSHPAAAAKKKLHSQIAAAQKQADAAKKEAKLSKLHFRTAKQSYKDARRAARKLRKAVKKLKTELAALAVRRRRKPAAPKPAPKRPALIVAPIAVPAPSAGGVETPPTPIVIPPIVPTV